MSEPTPGRQAVAAEVIAVMEDQRRPAKSVYDALGMGSSTWSNYFRKCDRDVPMETFRAVCAELGVPAWEVLRRVEGGDAPQEGPVTVRQSAAGLQVTVTVAVTGQEAPRG